MTISEPPTPTSTLPHLPLDIHLCLFHLLPPYNLLRLAFTSRTLRQTITQTPEIDTIWRRICSNAWRDVHDALIKFSRTGDGLECFDGKGRRRYQTGGGKSGKCGSFFELYVRRRRDEQFVCGGGVDEERIVSGDVGGSVYEKWASTVRPQVSYGPNVIEGQPDGSLVCHHKVHDLFSGNGFHLLPRQVSAHRHNGPVIAVMMNEIHLASIAIDPYIRVWDRETGSCINVLSAHHPVNPLLIQLLDKKLLIAYADGGLAVHKLAEKDRKRKVQNSQRWKGHDVPVMCAQLVEGSVVVVSGQESGVVKVWREAEFVHEICAGSRLRGVTASWDEAERVAKISVHAVHSKVSARVAM
ncbi:hypothetical protein HK097_008775 [Rhizophlyctis rosea]|uniref:F-box domain-containing protein n=1 Tax=Rhizophlyctis rosea TaxID=64517 RepID=A0AAD5X4C1_9FUNG|nr:hypothetical protein HK097_008775 [Rhizophlyctis rosea]